MFLKAKSHFFLWIKKECPFCKIVLQTLQSQEHPHTVYEMDDNLDELEKIKEMFDWKTVPIIVEQCPTGERNFIGGCSDLLEKMEK